MLFCMHKPSFFGGYCTRNNNFCTISCTFRKYLLDGPISKFSTIWMINHLNCNLEHYPKIDSTVISTYLCYPFNILTLAKAPFILSYSPRVKPHYFKSRPPFALIFYYFPTATFYYPSTIFLYYACFLPVK